MRTVVGKVVVLGTQGVGKTSTIMRYVQKTFTQGVSPTVGASFFTSNIVIGEDIIVKLQIWDTAGQERFKAMAPMFYRNANAALLVFDITAYPTFENIQNWVQELRKHVEEVMVLCVVGNKVDLPPELREVTKDEAMRYAKSIGASYLECSAKTDQGVGLIFDYIAHELVRLSGRTAKHSLKVYEDVEDIMAKSSTLDPTDVGVEESVNLSIDSIAHGKSVGRTCC